MSAAIWKLNNSHPDLISDNLLVIGAPAADERAIPKRDYVVPGYILRCVVTELLGPGGNGKSLLFLAWAIALALGLPFGDFVPPGPMRVATLDVEDDIEEQQRRCAAILRTFGRTEADLKDRLLLMTPAGQGTLLQFAGGRVAKRSALAQRLDRAIDTFKPDVLMLNPLAELHDGEENDNIIVRTVVSELRTMAREKQLAVLIGHHTHKGVADPGNPDAGRGASARGGAVRKGFTLYKMSKDEAAKLNIKYPGSYFRLDGAKSNYDALNGTSWFEIVLHELDNGEVAPAPWPWTPPQEVITSELIADLIALVAVGHEDGEPWSPQIGQYKRSFSRICEKMGIKTPQGQKDALAAVLRAGVREETYTRSNRVPAKGLRHPDGRPEADWNDRAT